MLEIKKIYHYYGKAKALEEINLEVSEESLDAVIGPNGAGKTTLLRVITCLEEPDRGKIYFMGERIDESETYQVARKGIAHCPERRKLFPDMSVMENLKLGGYSLKRIGKKKFVLLLKLHLRDFIVNIVIDRKKFKERLDYVFKLFPRLKERKRQRAGTLSGGEQQMLAIARSLMANPKLLLMDEPSLGLAPKIKEAIFKAIKEIKKEGTTTLLVEQDAFLAMNVSDNIHVLEEGKIEMRGSKAELEKEPRIKQVYLGI